MQTYTSKHTSINARKLPKVYTKIKFKVDDSIFDYGCGRYIDHIKKYVESIGCKYECYDPYWNIGDTYGISDCNVFVCANVLNVIDDIDEIKNIIKLGVDNCDMCLFQIYEGDKSGIGKVSKQDCYQRNELTTNYMAIIKKLYQNIQISKVGNIIIVRK